MGQVLKSEHNCLVCQLFGMWLKHIILMQPTKENICSRYKWYLMIAEDETVTKTHTCTTSSQFPLAY